MHRTPLTAKSRRAALGALLLATLPLASCAELLSTLDNASQAYVLYQQNRATGDRQPIAAPTDLPDDDRLATLMQSLAQLQAANRR